MMAAVEPCIWNYKGNKDLNLAHKESGGMGARFFTRVKGPSEKDK